MQNGMITSMWTDARGSFRNDSFCAYDGDVNVNRFTAPKGQLDLEVEMQLPRLVGSNPELKIEDGDWWISYDEGTTWERLQSTGVNVFSSVREDDNYVYITLTSGTEIKIPKVRK